MDCNIVQDKIVAWLKNQLDKSGQNGFVIGVSGGIDSAVVSTLCAQTGKPIIVVSLPIGQNTKLADAHISWLTLTYPNVKNFECDLTGSLYNVESTIWGDLFDHNSYSIDTNENRDLVSANLRSRLRMCTLYAFANASRFLVVGTGNKIEDYGIGFFSKFGDGGVDLSPIGDLLKSEVRELGKHLGIIDAIVKAAPTDGLWADGRTDEDQIGATYDELEWAMNWLYSSVTKEQPTERQWTVLGIYLKRHNANKHKMEMPPICRMGY